MNLAELTEKTESQPVIGHDLRKPSSGLDGYFLFRELRPTTFDRRLRCLLFEKLALGSDR